MTTLAVVPAPPPRYGMRNVVRGELVKIMSLRSTWWTLFVTFAGGLGITAIASSQAGHHDANWYQGFDPTNNSLAGLLIAVLTIGVFGALCVTSEFGSGTIRPSLSASPRRPTFFTGKLLVVGALTLVVSEVLSFACFALGQAILRSGGAPTATLSNSTVLRAVILSGALVAMLGLLAAGIGFLVRHTAGAIATYTGLIILIPIVFGKMSGNFIRFTPIDILSSSVAAVVPQQNVVSVPVGMLLMIIYVVAACGLGAALFMRRDA